MYPALRLLSKFSTQTHTLTHSHIHTHVYIKVTRQKLSEGQVTHKVDSSHLRLAQGTAFASLDLSELADFSGARAWWGGGGWEKRQVRVVRQRIDPEGLKFIRNDTERVY